MNLRLTLLTLTIALVCASLPSAVTARKLWERNWREIKTEHFVIDSALPQSRSVALATELEHFRYVARLLITHADGDAFEERIPTQIYVLPSTGRLPGLIDRDYAGYFMGQMRANYAVIRESGDESDEVLKHEYVHFLTHNYNSLLYPAWFDEGFAEVLSTLTVRNGIIEYGRPMKWRIDTLTYAPWMSFSDLITTHDPGSLGSGVLPSFYAQSWLLMHYLMLGRDGHTFAAENTDFMRRSEGGEPPLEAFQSAFDVDPNDLQSTLLAYGRKLRYFRSESTFPLPTVSPKIRPLTVDEVAAALGLLALIRGSDEESEEYYAAALEANPKNANALAGMGDLRKHAKHFDEAEKLYAQAVAADPANANHELDWGEYFSQRANREENEEQRHALLVEARRHFSRSYQINPDNPETLDQNGITYLYQGEEVGKGVTSLEAAYAMLPSQPQIQRDLAYAYMGVGRFRDARAFLTRLLTWENTDNADAIRKVLDQLPDDDRTSAAPGEGSQDGKDGSPTEP